MLQISLVKTVPRSRHRPTYVQLRGCATVSEHSPERQAAPGHSLQTHLNHLRFTSVLHKSSILATCCNAPLDISDAAVGQPGRQLCSSGSLKRVPPGTYENYSFPSSSARSTSVISEWPDGCRPQFCKWRFVVSLSVIQGFQHWRHQPSCHGGSNVDSAPTRVALQVSRIYLSHP